MNRVDALKAAEETVDRIAPKGVTLAVRVDAVLKVAEFLAGPPDLFTDPLPAPPGEIGEEVTYE